MATPYDRLQILSFAVAGWLIGAVGSTAQTVSSDPVVSEGIEPIRVHATVGDLWAAFDPGLDGDVPATNEGVPGDAPSDPVLSFPGLRSNANPPDTVMDVGRDHIVQMVNVTFFQVWDKEGRDWTGGPVPFGALWPLGNPCRTSAGDPIVAYDHLADRWLLSQFANPAYMCIAVSLTASPLPHDGFLLYTVPVPTFPDYPKFGVWSDAYYMSTYEGANLGVYAFDRESMLNGYPAGFVRFTLPSLLGRARDTRILPADLDGPRARPRRPGLFLRTVDSRQDAIDPRDRLEIFEFQVNWSAPALSSFTLIEEIDGSDTPALESFKTMFCNRHGAGIRDCIPQPDSDDTLDALSNRPMMQLKFRVMPDGFRLVVNQTVDVSLSIPDITGITPAFEVAGLRWYELQYTDGRWSIRQQGTYAPQPSTAATESDLLHRWMGSAAIDRFGNIALGYSVVSDDFDDGVTTGHEVYPGIRYTGRRFDDPLGTMGDEKIILNGTRPQGNLVPPVIPQRWGDYSAMAVDPVDDCTFWYTTHVAGGFTHIASFAFDVCRAGDWPR